MSEQIRSPKKPRKVLACTKPDIHTWSKEEFEKGWSHEMDDIISGLEAKGIITKKVKIEKATDFEELKRVYKEFKPDIVLANFHSHVTGDEGEKSWVFEICDSCRMPHVFGSKRKMEILMDKNKCQRKLQSKGIPCLPSVKATHKEEDEIRRFVSKHGKVVIKPIKGYCSCGIKIRENAEDVIEEVKRIEKKYEQPTLLEKYAKGKEYQIMIIGNGEKMMVLPVKLTKTKEIYDFKSKFDPKGAIRERVEDKCKEKKLIELGKAVAEALNIKDFTRMEVLEYEGEFYPIDVNGTPVMEKSREGGPSTLTQFAKLFGKTYEDLIEKIVCSAYKRTHLQ